LDSEKTAMTELLMEYRDNKWEMIFSSQNGIKKPANSSRKLKVSLKK
jgi:hypothetical protein